MTLQRQIFNTNGKDSLIKINKLIKLKVFENRRILMDCKKRQTYLIKALIGVVVVMGCVLLAVNLGSNSNDSLGLMGIDGKLIYQQSNRILQQSTKQQAQPKDNKVYNEPSTQSTQNKQMQTPQSKNQNQKFKKENTQQIISQSSQKTAISQKNHHNSQQKKTQDKQVPLQKLEQQKVSIINKNEQHKEKTEQHKEKTQQHKEKTQQHKEKTQQHKEKTEQHKEKTEYSKQKEEQIYEQEDNESFQQQDSQQQQSDNFSQQKSSKSNSQQKYIGQQQQQLQQANSNEIQWPKKNQLYHIYSAINPRLVLDVAKANDGFHDLILYQWQNSPNQMYYFEQVQGNFYHIINAQSKQKMKKSQKIIASTGVSKVKFSKQTDNNLWQLVPAKQNAKNSFYIVSQEKLALDLNEGYANNGAEIILYDWSKNDNQVWFFRKNKLQFSIQEFNVDRYEEKLSELLYKVMSNPDSINECITFQEIKRQMASKNIPIPVWLQRPQISEPNIFEMPPQTSMSQHQINKNLKKTQTKSLRKKSMINQENKQEASSLKSNKVEENQNKVDFKPQKLVLQCAKNHTVAYIWYGQKQMPEQYKELLTKCKKNVKLLTEKYFARYVQKWNKLEPVYAIEIEDYIIRQRINLLKLLYLFFESGIYADFDTQINEQCFQNVYADEIIWTSRLDEKIRDQIVFPLQQIVVPEESFMMIRTKQHPQLKRMLQQEIMEHNQRGGQRWKECKYRQCLIIQCQRHYRDNTYKKGFD